MMRRSQAVTTSLILATAVVVFPVAAQAYVGPGAGLSLLSALWGIIAAIAIAVFFVVMWPIRRMMRRRKMRRADAESAEPSQPQQPSPAAIQPQPMRSTESAESSASRSSDSSPPPSS
ncbi:hypothetical protein ACPF7Z_13755 [Halomonas sp. GXIMD04776]|uniref:hypothetical protein n=1 Tax=Halomonas sp. GXIMD04776 TaxID=3415605 RepID=UPI003C93CE32